jgi:S1-C subfamily serine protease
VVNHMSGGPVVDAAGNVIGIVVNGNRNTAGVLSIENVLSTFFSKVGKSNVQPAVILNPTETPLYLRDER